MLDIFDLNHDISHEGIGQINKLPQFKNKGWVYGLSRFFYGLFISIIKFRFNIFVFKSKNIVFFVSSHNQYKALQHYNSSEGNKYVAVGVNYNNEDVKNRYPEALAYLLSIPFLPVVIFQYILCKDTYKKKSLKICLDRYMLSYGLYVTTFICLVLSKPKMIAFANDHCVWHRVLLKVCKRLAIKTFYCQHAMVSQYFPPLEFDYCFLDGDISNQQYKRANSSSQIYLTGSAYLDVLSNSDTSIVSDKSIVFGLCFNKIDSDVFIKKLIGELIAELKSNECILVRLHPADNRFKYLQSEITSNNVIFSDAKIESMSSFLARVHGLLAGDSSVHLEAVLKNKLSCTLSYWSTDYYSFVKEGIINNLDSIVGYCSEVRNLKSKEIINKNLRKYKADLGLDISIKFLMFEALLLDEKLKNKTVSEYMIYREDSKSFVYKSEVVSK